MRNGSLVFLVQKIGRAGQITTHILGRAQNGPPGQERTKSLVGIAVQQILRHVHIDNRPFRLRRINIQNLVFDFLDGCGRRVLLGFNSTLQNRHRQRGQCQRNLQGHLLGLHGKGLFLDGCKALALRGIPIVSWQQEVRAVRFRFDYKRFAVGVRLHGVIDGKHSVCRLTDENNANRLLNNGFHDNGRLNDGPLNDGLLDDGLLDNGFHDNGRLNDGPLNDGLLDDGLLDNGFHDNGRLNDRCLDDERFSDRLLSNRLLNDRLLSDRLLDDGLLKNDLLGGGYLKDLSLSEGKGREETGAQKGAQNQRQDTLQRFVSHDNHSFKGTFTGIYLYSIIISPG